MPSAEVTKRHMCRGNLLKLASSCVGWCDVIALIVVVPKMIVRTLPPRLRRVNYANTGEG